MARSALKAHFLSPAGAMRETNEATEAQQPPAAAAAAFSSAPALVKGSR